MQREGEAVGIDLGSRGANLVAPKWLVLGFYGWIFQMQVFRCSVNIKYKWIREQVKFQIVCFKISKSPADLHFQCV